MGGFVPSYSATRPYDDLRYVWLSNSGGVNFAPGGLNHRPDILLGSFQRQRALSHPATLPPAFTPGVAAPAYRQVGSPARSVEVFADSENENESDEPLVRIRCRDRVRWLGKKFVVRIRDLQNRRGNREDGESSVGV